MDSAPDKPMARNFSLNLRFKDLVNRLKMGFVTRPAPR